MRTMTILAAAAMLALAPAAYAQTEAPAPEATQPQAQAPTIKKVQVVDLAELPAEQQTRVTTATSNTTEADLKGLRDSIDANTMASAALKAEGVGSEAVVAALISTDGTLTLVTKKS